MPSCSIGFSVASTRKGSGELARHPVDRDLLLGHRLEERRLRLRHRAVDLVDEDDVREHGAGPELEVALPLVEDGEAGDVRRLEVGRALDARFVAPSIEPAIARARIGLRRPRDVLEQHVPAAEERRQDELDLLPLPEDDRLDVPSRRPDRSSVRASPSCSHHLTHACEVARPRLGKRHDGTDQRALRNVHSGTPRPPHRRPSRLFGVSVRTTVWIVVQRPPYGPG